MSPPVVIYDGFSATVPAFSHTDDVTFRLPDDMYFGWLTERNRATFTVVPWYTASLGSGAEGLYVNAGSFRQVPLSAASVVPYINGGPALQGFHQIIFVTNGTEALSSRVVNTTAADLAVTDLTLAAVMRPNSTGLPDYTADWTGIPPEIFGDPPIADYLDISDTLPNSGDAVSLIMPSSDHGGVGPSEAAVNAFPIPFPQPDIFVPYFTGIPNTFDPGTSDVGLIVLAFWDSNGALMTRLNAQNHVFPMIDGAAYWAMWALLPEPVDGAGNVVPTQEVTFHLAMYLVRPINFSSSANGAIAFNGLAFQFGARIQRTTRAFAMVVR